MIESKNLIKNSLNYYDKNMEKYNKFLSKIRYVNFVFYTEDTKKSIIIFYDKDKKEIFKSRYEVLGAYNNTSKTWIWGWSIPNASKNLTFISKKILNYGLDIDDNDENLFLKTELITSRFRITNEIQLEIHIAISSYISKIPLLFNIHILPERLMKLNENKFYEINTEKAEKYTMYSFFILDYDKIPI